MLLDDYVNLQFAEFSYVILLCVTVYSVLTFSGLVYLCCLFGLWICLKVIKKKTAGRIETNNKAVFITGCDTGFGHDLARRLDELEFHVFAGCLHSEGDGAKKLKAASSKRLHIVPIDVGSDTSMEAAHDYVVKHLPKNGLWAIVNNAGFNVMGNVELLTIDLYKKIMNVNFYGAVRTVRNFLYLVRKTKGRVVIVTSVRGLISYPADSAYHLTKHGLETMADCLRLEMRKFGVQVSVVEPGDYGSSTACQDETNFRRYQQEADEMWSAASDEVRSTYGRAYIDAWLDAQRAAKSFSSDTTTEPVIDALVDAVVSGRPDTRYLVAGGKWIDRRACLARVNEYVPTWIMDWIMVKLSGCERFPLANSNKKTD